MLNKIKKIPSVTDKEGICENWQVEFQSDGFVTERLVNFPEVKPEFIPVSINVSKERIEDMLVGALEGGSNYWYWLPDQDAENIRTADGQCFATKMLNYIWKNDNVINIHDAEDEDEKLGEFSYANIIKGLQLMQKEQPEHFADMLSETDDATTADVWFQFVVLQELVYG
jgi:hypothetical protein